MTTDSCAVITGAASGIGRALAVAAASRGLFVALADLDGPGLQRTADEIAARGGRALTRTLDVCSAGAMADFADAVGREAPPAQLLFANAGYLRAGPWWRQPAEEIRRSLEVNVIGVVNTVQAFLPGMIGHGGPGRVAITGSVGSLLAAPGLGAYAASKHAVLALAETLKHDLEAQGSAIGVSLVCPGAVRTGLLDAAPSDLGARLQGRLKARMDEAGLEPARLAEIVFDGIDQRRFWIFPQPAFKAAAGKRFEGILAEADPERP